jgi:hypothetical protein
MADWLASTFFYDCARRESRQKGHAEDENECHATPQYQAVQKSDGRQNSFFATGALAWSNSSDSLIRGLSLDGCNFPIAVFHEVFLSLVAFEGRK